jgi:CheY-like chemotaxis protein
MDDNRLLIVDDEQDICSNMRDILTECGYSVDVASEWREGLDLLKQHRYRLALLDYKLPGVTGVELFQQMRQLNQGIEGLLVTAYASDKTAQEALAAGMQAVVQKPVDLSHLISLLQESEHASNN